MQVSGTKFLSVCHPYNTVEPVTDNCQLLHLFLLLQLVYVTLHHSNTTLHLHHHCHNTTKSTFHCINIHHLLVSSNFGHLSHSEQWIAVHIAKQLLTIIKMTSFHSHSSLLSVMYVLFLLPCAYQICPRYHS